MDIKEIDIKEVHERFEEFYEQNKACWAMQKRFIEIDFSKLALHDPSLAKLYSKTGGVYYETIPARFRAD